MDQTETEDVIKQLKSGAIVDRESLTVLKGQQLSGYDLAGVNFSQVDLSGTSFFGCNLRGANFFKATLTKADFTGADVSEANFSEAMLDETSFGRATMNGTKCFGSSCADTTFTGVEMNECDFRASNMENVRMREAKLNSNDFTSCIMRGADLSFSNVYGSIFNDADMRDTMLRHIKGFRKAHWLGVDIRNINFSGAYRTRRFIVDQNYLHEFKNQGKLYEWIYFVWWLTSNCGRSLFRWLAVIIVQILLYASLYSMLDFEFKVGKTWFSYIYFSIVTSTTLGYGDIIPTSSTAQIIAMTQVLLGYVMLGGFLSILTNKIARRAD